MELAVIFIAIFMGLLTLCGLILTLVAVFLSSRVSGTLKNVDGLLEDVRRETVPTIVVTRELLENAKDMSDTLRAQVGRAEQLMDVALTTVSETSDRLKKATDGLIYILSWVGKLTSIFKRKSKS